MALNFSQRLGLKPSHKQIQLERMDNDLKVGLWNAYLANIFGALDRKRVWGPSAFDRYITYMWHEYFKMSIDERPLNDDDTYRFIKTKYSKYTWNEVYEFLEFNASLNNFPLHLMTYQFVEECNRVLTREFSAYHFINNKVVPMSNDAEVKEVEEAISASGGIFKSPYKGVNIHLTKALEKLSDKNPDYSNSIKESISAVESLCRTLTNTSTLGEALKSLESKGITINQQLKQGIEKIYAYTNSKDTGIRHALIDSPIYPTFEDAKFMMVTCSALTNYLIAKSK